MSSIYYLFRPQVVIYAYVSTCALNRQKRNVFILTQNTGVTFTGEIWVKWPHFICVEVTLSRLGSDIKCIRWHGLYGNQMQKLIMAVFTQTKKLGKKHGTRSFQKPHLYKNIAIYPLCLRKNWWYFFASTRIKPRLEIQLRNGPFLFCWPKVYLYMTL